MLLRALGWDDQGVASRPLACSLLYLLVKTARVWHSRMPRLTPGDARKSSALKRRNFSPFVCLLRAGNGYASPISANRRAANRPASKYSPATARAASQCRR